MSYLTTNLIEDSQGMLKIVPEVRDDGKGYLMFDDGGVEVEVGEFIYGMVKILKPVRVLTTGIYTGISDMYIAQALKDNEIGHSDAIEYESFHIERAKRLWQAVGVADRITPHHCSSLDFETTYQYQFMFLDTEPHLRFSELVRFYPNLDPGGYVFIHDLPPNLTQGNMNPDHPEYASWPFGPLPKDIIQWVWQDKLRVIHFPNPRGMVGFYKVKEDDYKW